jgi:hypothetical protein
MSGTATSSPLNSYPFKDPLFDGPTPEQLRVGTMRISNEPSVQVPLSKFALLPSSASYNSFSDSRAAASLPGKSSFDVVRGSAMSAPEAYNAGFASPALGSGSLELDAIPSK